MNDLQYIFYDAKRMALDTMDMTRSAELAHRKLADSIWVQDKPPRDRDVTLCQVTHTPPDEWPAVRAELLEKGWVAAGGFLIHRGIIASLNDAKLRHAANFNRQCAMNHKPLKAVSEPDLVTGIIQVRSAGEVRTVTGGVTSKVMDNVRARGDARPPVIGGLAGRVVGDILRNSSGWCYDNCRVQPKMFVARALVSQLKPYLERMSGEDVLAKWDRAVDATHRAAVDGLVKSNIAGYCVSSWRKLMDEFLATDGTDFTDKTRIKHGLSREGREGGEGRKGDGR